MALWGKINDLQAQFEEDNLPIDFPEAILSDESNLAEEERVFIKQLKLIALLNDRIKKAISDYYCAVEQRSRWVREDLLIDNELELYEKHLVDEWERQYLKMKQDIGANPTESKKEDEGRKLYEWMDSLTTLPIRPKCSAPYVMRGSYHMLSNNLKVGWHLDFQKRLMSVLTKSVETPC